jgi:hypothetical protein
MIGKIKIIGANNSTHIGWMEKDFENCKIMHEYDKVHKVSVPDRGEFTFEITKTFIVEDHFIFEGYASIEDSLGKLAFEFRIG